MTAKMASLLRSSSRLKSLNPNILRNVSTSSFLSQEAQLDEATVSSPSPSLTSLPPSPSTGSPLYHENWRNPGPSFSQSLVPQGFMPSYARIQSFSNTLDLKGLMNVFADWVTSQRWSEMKELFECWIRSLDSNGKPNRPDVNVYNHYLRANLMLGASAGDLLDLVARMEDYNIYPNTASYNLVLKAMYQAKEWLAVVKLLDRMLQTGKDSSPDEESYDLVIGLLFQVDQIDSALKYLDLTLKSGYMVSMKVFADCMWRCIQAGRLDTLTSIIERCKNMDKNKALCPGWNTCIYMMDVALQEDNSKLAFFALEFLFRWMARGEKARPPVLLSVDEGLVNSSLATAARTCNATLIDASWTILQKSLRSHRKPSSSTYLSKIYALTSLGNLERAFSALRELESTLMPETQGAEDDKDGNEYLSTTFDELSPFTSLYPLAVACSKNGFESLDAVYFQLENLSRSNPPYKSVAALNCIILGCANIWDLDRAYQTFDAINSTFALKPNIHSYNALMYAFSKLKKTDEASRVFEHLAGLGVKPNAQSYSLLVDVHLFNRDPKSALSVIDDMMVAGFVPSKESLAKIKRRCVREFDDESSQKVQALCEKLRYRLPGTGRSDMLFSLEYTTYS